MRNENFNIISYKGIFDPIVFNKLKISLSDYLSVNDFPKNIQSKVIWIFIEMINNIQNHADKNFNSFSSIEVKFDKNKGEFLIISENCITNSQAKCLKNNILQLNNMSSDDLQAKYFAVMKNANEKTTNAGLGLIGIARKSDNFVSEIEFMNDDISKIKILVSIKL